MQDLKLVNVMTSSKQINMVVMHTIKTVITTQVHLKISKARYGTTTATNRCRRRTVTKSLVQQRLDW